MKLPLISICIVAALAGCETTRELQIPDEKMLVNKVEVDKRLLEPCNPDLAPLSGNQPEDVLKAFGESAKIHDKCVAKDNELIGLVKRMFGIKD